MKFATEPEKVLRDVLPLLGYDVGDEQHNVVPMYAKHQTKPRQKRGCRMKAALIVANLALLVLFPVAWFAPLLRAGLLPMFGLSRISVISGLQSLWGSDVALALLVTVLAVFAPYLKTIALALLQFGLLSHRVMPALHILGKLAMGDVFLIALYIVVAKGVGHATVRSDWGLYLFTGCILGSLAVSIASARVFRDPR